MKALEPHAYVLLRIVTGFMFTFHGVQKLFGWPPMTHSMDATQQYTAGVIEFAGGLLITVGLCTRPVAFLCCGLMAAAYWMEHGLREGAPLPIQNRGDAAVLYCFVFLLISARGSGKLSIDRARENAKKK